MLFSMPNFINSRWQPPPKSRQRLTKAAPKSEFLANKNKKTPLALRQRDHFVIGAYGMILGG